MKNNDGMTRKKNPVTARVLAVLSMFALILVLLLTSFQLAIYGDSDYRFYEKEYEKYHVTASLDMRMEDVMDVTRYMMDYLIGKEDVLSIETDVDGKRQDFFNEQDRFHMEEVKNLFLGGLRLRNDLLLLSLFCILVLVFAKADVLRILSSAYKVAFAVFLLLLLVMGVAFFLDFNACFTLFHQIFFDNDLWLFDERTDYMIRMLTEGFFFDFTKRILLTFVGMLVGFAGIFCLAGRLHADSHDISKMDISEKD